MKWHHSLFHRQVHICVRILEKDEVEMIMKAANIWRHFRTITWHKWLVMKNCFRVGLYRQGICHDLSKYSPSEFWTGVKYYQGNRSPNAANGRFLDIPKPGFIIREEINIILNTGSIFP